MFPFSGQSASVNLSQCAGMGSSRRDVLIRPHLSVGLPSDAKLRVPAALSPRPSLQCVGPSKFWTLGYIFLLHVVTEALKLVGAPIHIINNSNRLLPDVPLTIFAFVLLL